MTPPLFRLAGGRLALLASLLLLSSQALAQYQINTESTGANSWSGVFGGTVPAGSTVRVVAPADGFYTGINITIDDSGTASQPIVIYADPLGSVKFNGQTRLNFTGSHVILAGFVFDGQQAGGGTPVYAATGAGVVTFAASSSNITVTNCVFNRIRSGANSESAENYYVYGQGRRHTLEYNAFLDKRTFNATVFLDENTADQESIDREHVMRGNYFGERNLNGSNGVEAVRLGDSGSQNWEFNARVYNNVFHRAFFATGSEQEIVSNKSDKNLYIANTFRNNQGGLTLRHGDDCIVFGNYFFGKDYGATTAGAQVSGIKIIGENHLIVNNYLEDITGANSERGAITIMQGESAFSETNSSTRNGYEAPDNAIILYNTLINPRYGISFNDPNTNSTSRVQANRVYFYNNVVLGGANTTRLYDFGSNLDNIEFRKNYLWALESGDYQGARARSPSIRPTTSRATRC